MGETVLRNRYRVLRRLGAGGGGSVYMVEELHATGQASKTRLALKALFTDETTHLLLSSLRLEFRVLANLRHPLLARVYDFGSIPQDSGLEGSDGRPGYFFTRDLIDGQDLETHCRELELPEICRVCQQTAEVLDVLHRSGMVHGDFKPANVIVGADDDRPRLIDFGLVRTEGQSAEASGTAAYLAPEVLRGQPIDRRADLYGLGISIYQLVTKHLPLPNANLAELVAWHLDGDPLQISVEEGVPVELDQVVTRLTNRDPDRRYPSAAEAALALAEAASKAGGEAAPSLRGLFIPPAPGENLTEPLVELEAAARSRTLSREGGPPLIAVEGEPGAGKSTLLQELAWRCQLGGIEVIRAEFRAGDPRAYGLWVDLLSQISGVVGTTHPLEDPTRHQSTDRYALYQRISEYLARSSAEVPLLLLLDNGEQATEEDRAALRFISHTLDPEDRIQVVLAYRTEEHLRRDLGSPPQRRLSPLSIDDVRRMVSDASGRHDGELAERIHGHTGGNPQFMIDVLRRLDEAGWPANPDLQRLAPPRGLEAMVTGRLGDLDPSEQVVLQSLAVLGRPANGALLMEVVQQTSTDTRSSQVGLPLERLEELEWLDRAPDGVYSFRQGPAAWIIYSQMPDARRREIHLAVAQVLERAADRDPVEWTRHAVGAGRIDLAEQSFDKAIALLKSLGAHRSAIRLSEEAAALPAIEPDRLLQIRLELGELYYTVGEYERAGEALQLACSEAQKEQLLQARISLAKVHRAAGETDQALCLLQEVLDGRPPSTVHVAALTEAAAAHLALNAHEEVLETVQQALDLLDSDDQAVDLGSRADLRGQMALSLVYLQRFEEAATALETALADARAADDRRVEANILNRWAILAYRQGDLARVPERYRAALECARQTGDVERMAAIQLNLATYHLHSGEYAACLEHLPECLRLFEAMGAQKNLAHARCNMGLLEYKLGLHEQARATLNEALQETRQVSWKSGQAVATLTMALVQARRSEIELARQGIAQARAITLELDQHRDAADALLDLADIELTAGNRTKALDAITTARAEVDLAQVPDLKVRAAALEARALALSGSVERRVEAALALEAALVDAEEIGSPELMWDCQAAAMELSDASGQPRQAAQHARAAAQILERIAENLPTEVRAAFWQDDRRRAVRARAALHQQAHAAEAGGTMPATKDGGSGGPPLADPAVDMTLPVVTPPGPLPVLPPQPQQLARVTHVEERFYRLLEIYRQINSELDPERLLGLVMDTAVELTGAERGFLLLGDTPAKLKVEVARNLDVEGETGAYSRSIAEQVFTTGQPVITVSAHNDPRFKEYMSVHQLQLESVLCIPIHARGKTSGILYMESRFQSGRFTPEDQRLLMAFGDQVAIALTNARLVTDNIRKAEELERAKQEIEALAEERGRLLNQRTLQLEEARRDLAETLRKLESKTGMFGMVGRSPPMVKLFQLVERVAATDVPVLIEGESGTGKEMVARAIHQTSERKKGRLVSVNCAAIPENLLESELFGHVRGAFTGADRERKGLFQAAHGGTLFLDEIGDMPARMQVDLLRALQEKTIRPIGAQQDIKVDVRVIAASNKSLVSLVQSKIFREDLYYRLNVVTLKIPSLRQRADDIPLLVDHFLNGIASQMKAEKKKITRHAMRRLMEYSWPGNVRQLEHTLMNATVLADDDVLDERDFTLEAPQTAPSPIEPITSPDASPGGVDRKAKEQQEILEMLEACNWNKSHAAKQLGIPRRTFYRRLKEYGIR